MNLQRREEIRMMIADENIEDPQAPTDCRHVLPELLAHIDTLEQAAAERVISRGAARALAQPSDATLASLAACGSTEGAVRATLSWARRMLARTDGPTPDYTGEGSAWVPPVEARAVVVPELTDEDIRREWAALHIGIDGPPDESALSAFEEGLKQGYNLAASRARAIPADRVLGEGMVAVDRGDIDTLSKAIDKIVLDSWARSNAEDASVTALCLAFQPIHSAIRANQGGAAT